jgi:hypothetical protein
MKAFAGLLKKDLLLMRFWYVVWLIFTALYVGGGYAFTQKIDEPSAIVPMLVMLAVLHISLMPIMIVHVLNVEGKTQLWLYNPQSSLKLLFSKLAAGVILQVISQAILALYALFVVNILKSHDFIGRFTEFLPTKQGMLFELGIFSVSLYMSVWVLFLWTIYHSLGKYPAIRNFRWLAVIVVWVAFNLFEALLAKLNIIQNGLFLFGVNMQISPSMSYDLGKGWSIQMTPPSMPIVSLVMYTIEAIVIFLITARLLDRKVEV